MSSTEGTAGIAAPSGTPLDTTGAVTSFTKKKRSYKAPAATAFLLRELEELSSMISTPADCTTSKGPYHHQCCFNQRYRGSFLSCSGPTYMAFFENRAAQDISDG